MGRFAEWSLRVGLAFAFLYPPVSAFFDPFAWIGFFPQFVRDVFNNDALLLHAFGIIEVALAVWVLLARNVFIPSVVMALMLAGIIVFNWGAMPVIFRDISILAMAISLACIHLPRRIAAVQ